MRINDKPEHAIDEKHNATPACRRVCIRQNAEDVLIKLGDERVADLGVESDDEWGLDE